MTTTKKTLTTIVYAVLTLGLGGLVAVYTCSEFGLSWAVSIITAISERFNIVIGGTTITAVGVALKSLNSMSKSNTLSLDNMKSVGTTLLKSSDDLKTLESKFTIGLESLDNVIAVVEKQPEAFTEINNRIEASEKYNKICMTAMLSFLSEISTNQNIAELKTAVENEDILKSVDALNSLKSTELTKKETATSKQILAKAKDIVAKPTKVIHKV